LEQASSASRAAHVIKSGTGEMRLSGNNSFTGQLAANDGQLTLASSTAAGVPGAGVILNNSSVLAIDGNLAIENEPLTINSTNTVQLKVLSGASYWNSSITLNRDTTMDVASAASLDIYFGLGGTGNFTKTGFGTLQMLGSTGTTNTNTVTVVAGTLLLNSTPSVQIINGPLVIGDGLGGANADVVRLSRMRQIANSVPVTIHSSGLLDLQGHDESFGALSGSGHIDLGSGANFEANYPSATSTFDGLISGTGNFYKDGTGTLSLNGDNTYVGNTIVYAPTPAEGGTLLVNGFQPQSPVIISNGCTLGGFGTVGNITAVSGATVAPGPNAAGLLVCSNLLLNSGAAMVVELTGVTKGHGYDGIDARGTVSIGGASLTVLPSFGLNSSAPSEGTQFLILRNDGADAITGTFTGKADNSIFMAGGMQFRIDYDGGTGANDVVLTLTNTALRVAGAAYSSGNGNALIDSDECDLISIVLTNRAGDTSTNVQAFLLSETPGITITQPFADYSNIAANSIRTNTTPFQISTAPTFACGTPVICKLVLQTSNHGTYTIPVTLTNTASPGGLARFDNAIQTAIPDLDTTNILFNVNGLATAIEHVEVSFHITHTTDADLDIYLVGPDGTRVELTTDNGGTLDDYGLSCADVDRTLFSDSGATLISTAGAPFVGTFRPEGSLTSFIGKSGTNANGTWKLEVSDDAAGGLGTVRCASLFVYAALCSAGGGICELCPNQTLSASLGPTSLTHDRRLIQNGVPSLCASPKTCPGSLGAGPQNRSYNAHVFRNGPTTACIGVLLTSPVAYLCCAAYSNSFDTNDLCANYIGDAGDPTDITPWRAFSFTASPNQLFVIVVDEDTAGSGGNYQLTVIGGDCQPQLHLTRNNPNTSVLDWTTAAASIGYGLEHTNKLPANAVAWPALTNVPVIVNSRYQVTNLIAETNQFYRLRKPLP
jgi:autotransporter-associated beta strand protein